MPAEPIYSFAALRNRLHVRGSLVALTAFRIGAGRSSRVNSNDLPVLRDSGGAPFVPGASLKGAFRARIEALVRAIHDDQARDLPGIEDHMRDEIMPLIQANRAVESDSLLSQQIWTKSTLIDLAFGAPWVAGRIFFKDALIDRSLWSGRVEVRNGVALNRDTETVEQGLLYDYEVVPAGMRFGFELAMENADDWQLGMVLLALRPWRNGDVQIGGFRSRGLGHVQLIDVKAHYTTIATPDDVLALLGYGDGGATRDLSLDDPDDVMRGWFEAFKRALSEPKKVIAEGARFDA
jgi:CRISPR-associated RAMP protein (TIGR02581 family)